MSHPHRRAVALVAVLFSIGSAIACSSPSDEEPAPNDDTSDAPDAGRAGTRDASTASSDDGGSVTKDSGRGDPPLVIDGGVETDASTAADASADATAIGDASLDADAGPPKLTLNWMDNSTNEDGFAIDRKISGSATYGEIATVPANVTTYVDYAVVRGVTYCYQVRAFNDGGTSVPSAEACAAPK